MVAVEAIKQKNQNATNMDRHLLAKNGGQVGVDQRVRSMDGQPTEKPAEEGNQDKVFRNRQRPQR